MSKTIKANFASALPKTCIVVNAKTPHVRNYRRAVKNGMSRVQATWHAAYAQMLTPKRPFFFKDFV